MTPGIFLFKGLSFRKKILIIFLSLSLISPLIIFGISLFG